MSINHVIDQSDQKLIEQALGKRISRDKIISDINGDPDTKVIFNTFSPEDQEKIIAFLAGERTLQRGGIPPFQVLHPDPVSS